MACFRCWWRLREHGWYGIASEKVRVGAMAWAIPDGKAPLLSTLISGTGEEMHGIAQVIVFMFASCALQVPDCSCV
jgi:hypothetical protein